MPTLHTNSITPGLNNIWLYVKNTVCSKLVSLLPSSPALLTHVSVPLLALPLSWTIFLCPDFFQTATRLKDLFPARSCVAFSSSLISFLPGQVKHSLFTCNLALFTHFVILRLFYKHSTSLLIFSKVYAKSFTYFTSFNPFNNPENS